jgi:transcriptional regulator with XRE-family HTH domain
MCSVDTAVHSDSNNAMGKGARSRLARTLRLLRAARDWTQEDLAHASGLHRTSISLIERMASGITLDTLERLANTFGITVPELLDDTDSGHVGERALAKPGRATKKTKGRRS